MYLKTLYKFSGKAIEYEETLLRLHKCLADVGGVVDALPVSNEAHYCYIQIR